MQQYWTYEHDGDIKDHEFNNWRQAMQQADEDFYEEDPPQQNFAYGYIHERPINLVRFEYNNDGERINYFRIGTIAGGWEAEYA